MSAISRSSGWDGSLPASSITVSPGLPGLGCILQKYPAPQQSPAAGVPGLQQGSPLKVLGTSAVLALPSLSPGPNRYLTTSRATGRKSRLPSSFDAKSRNILPANRIAPFWPPPPLQETVFCRQPSAPLLRLLQHLAESHRRQRMQRPWVDSQLQMGAQCLAKSGHRDAGRSGRALRRRGPGRFPDRETGSPLAWLIRGRC